MHWSLQDKHAVLVGDPQLQFGLTPAGEAESELLHHQRHLLTRGGRGGALPAISTWRA